MNKKAKTIGQQNKMIMQKKNCESPALAYSFNQPVSQMNHYQENLEQKSNKKEKRAKSTLRDETKREKLVLLK